MQEQEARKHNGVIGIVLPVVPMPLSLSLSCSLLLHQFHEQDAGAADFFKLPFPSRGHTYAHTQVTVTYR